MISSGPNPSFDAAQGDGLTIQVVDEIDSTNRALMDAVFADRPLPPRLLVARRQSAGRGRRGRGWLTEPGRSLACSVSIERVVCGDGRPAGALPLVAGLAVVVSLAGLGSSLRLKWPNDLQRDGMKVGGILVETRRQRVKSLHIERFVIGVGLNLLAPRDADASIGQPFGGIFEREPLEWPIETLAARLAGTIAQSAARLFDEGFGAFLEDWNRFDALKGRAVIVLGHEDAATTGVAAGVDRDGALLVQTSAGLQRILNGEVSVRALTDAGHGRPDSPGVLTVARAEAARSD